MTSKSEGIPVVLMEAMAHEKTGAGPAITGIPNWSNTGAPAFFTARVLCPISSAPCSWILEHKASLAEIGGRPRRASPFPTIASEICAILPTSSWPASPNRRLTYAHSLLQQVRLSV